MSKTNIEYELKGAFKMDTYDAHGNFVETTDWFSNFITQTGLIYPTIYSFANCFRFLTIGKDAGNNYGGLGAAVPSTDGNGNVHQRNPTTGCFDPIFSFTDSTSSTQHGTWMGWEGYETGSDPLINSSCRTITSPNGIRFYRAWQVPSGADGVTMNQTGGFLNIQELSVSPSDGNDTTGCFAFSRVARNLPLKNGYRAVISYQLQINCSNYTLSSFSGGTFNTGLADVSTDLDMISGWANASGLYRQVWAGLSCVDSYGVSFIPKYGNGMEPSLTDLSRYYMYLSPDNSQFDVNNTGGGSISSSLSAWASDGIMKPIVQDLSLTAERTSLGNSSTAIRQLFYGSEQKNNTIPNNNTPFNIRLGSTNITLKAPNLVDYTVAPTYLDTSFNYQGVDTTGPKIVSARNETISYSTPGGAGMSIGIRSNDTQEKAVFSTRMYKLPMDASVVGNMPTGRRKNISRRALFTPSSSRGYNSRFGSLVFAYLNNNDTLGDYTYYPLMDSLFYDTSGQAQLQHYRLISGIYLTERGTGIAGCSVTIRPIAGNIQRHVSRRTFQGPVSGYVQNPGWVTDVTGTWRIGNMISGNNTGWRSTSGNSSWFTGAAPASQTGCSGWGAVIGFLGDDYNNASDPGNFYFDMGIAEHPSGLLTEPTGGNPSSLYWPYTKVGQKLYVDFHNIIFFSGYGNLWPDAGGTATQLASSGFCRPTGYIVHSDSIAGEGHRLLPHFGIATTDVNDSLYYNTANNTTDIGGSLPGLSLDNGLEIYMDISWNSDCRGCVAGSCLDPVTMAPN